MFQGFTDETFDFFTAIQFNNNTEFFHSNHDWYIDSVRKPCLALAEALSDAVEAVDDDLERRPNRVLSRINRDLRFSRDKSPYRDHLWLGYRHPARETGRERFEEGLPGLYFEIDAQSASYGMGAYAENRPLMNGLRRRMLTEPEAFIELLDAVQGEFTPFLRTFKRMKLPDELHPALRPWYPVRGFWLEKTITDFSLLKSPALADEVAGGFTRLAPIYRYVMSTPPEMDADATKERP